MFGYIKISFFFVYTLFLSDKKILFFLIIKRMRKWSRERMISLIHVMHEAILKVITSNSSHLLVCWTSREPMATRIWQQKMKKKKPYLSHCFKSKWQYKAWLISIYNTYKLILFVKQTFFFVINLINNGNINYFNKIIKVLGKRDQAHHQNYTVSNKLINFFF